MKLKKLACLALCLALLLCALPAAAVDVDGHRVQLSDQNLNVNGKTYDCEKYNIDGSNFFKLRDLAYLLNGTASQFDVGYDKASNTVTVTTGLPYTQPSGAELALRGDRSATGQVSPQSLIINGVSRTDLTVWNFDGSNFFKLRELGDALGFGVDYDPAARTMLVTSTDYVPPLGDPVTRSQAAVGSSTAEVLTVDLKDPRVTVKSAMVQDTVGATASFRDIVAAAGDPVAVVNGNFFESYQAFQCPIGHVMAGGQFLFASSGLHSLGIDGDGNAKIGKEPVFIRVALRDGGGWAAFSANVPSGQNADASTLYTPAWGPSLDVTENAHVLTVKGGRLDSYRAVSAGESVPIPADGYVVFMGSGYTSTSWFADPGASLGSAAVLEPYLFNPTEDAFDLTGMVSILSGSPRLVKDGQIYTEMEEGFSDPSRFGPSAASPRTAVGVDAAGKLIIVSAPSATIQQLRELMLSLGCVDAINLDGGGSRAMYYRGNYLAEPGRQLTTTLQVFVNG